MAEIALSLIASRKSLAYGGDLRQHGFTEFLAELLRRYRNHPLHGGTVGVTSYLAWPVHIRMTSTELAAFSAEHEPAMHLVFLALDGGRLKREERLGLHPHEPHEDEWAEGLTAMRNGVRGDIRARIVLDGRVEGHKGTMPGIAEETSISLEAGQPVFVLGGFGGCARDVAETVGLIKRWSGRGKHRLGPNTPHPASSGFGRPRSPSDIQRSGRRCAECSLAGHMRRANC